MSANTVQGGKYNNAGLEIYMENENPNFKQSEKKNNTYLHTSLHLWNINNSIHMPTLRERSI